jgi:hypothetical protein
MGTSMPWWLEEQTEVCVFCMQPYACGLECWCVRCDIAVCPLCAATIQEAGVEAYACPECRTTATTDAEGPQEAA